VIGLGGGGQRQVFSRAQRHVVSAEQVAARRGQVVARHHLQRVAGGGAAECALLMLLALNFMGGFGQEMVFCPLRAARLIPDGFPAGQVQIIARQQRGVASCRHIRRAQVHIAPRLYQQAAAGADNGTDLTALQRAIVVLAVAGVVGGVGGFRRIQGDIVARDQPGAAVTA